MHDIDESEAGFLMVMTTVHGSVIPHIWGGMLYSLLVGCAAVFVKYQSSQNPHTLWSDFFLAGSPLTITGTLLGFLLVFRTNIAYQRYWEARGAMGAAVKCSRDLASMAATFVVGEDKKHAHERANMSRLIRLSFTALVHEVNVDPHPKKWAVFCADDHCIRSGELSKEEVAMILSVQRPTLLLLQWLRHSIHKCKTTPVDSPGHKNDSPMLQEADFYLMDRNISEMIVAFNAVTKIKSTPIPFAFAQMCKTFIFAYISLFPFSVVGDIGK
jgi:putative membrane protein